MKKHFEQNKPTMTDGEQRRVWGAIHDARRAGRKSRPRRLAIPIAALGGVAVALLVVVRLGTLDTVDRQAVDQLVTAQPEMAAPGVGATPMDDRTEAGGTASTTQPEVATTAPGVATEDRAVAVEASADKAVPEAAVIRKESAPVRATEKNQESAPVATNEAVSPADHASARRAATLRQQTQDKSLRAGAIAHLEESLGKAPETIVKNPVNTPPAGPDLPRGGKPSPDAMTAKIVPLDALSGSGSIQAASFVGSAVGSLAVLWQVDESRRLEQAELQRKEQRRRALENAAKIAEASNRRHETLVRKAREHETLLEKQGYVAIVPDDAGDPNGLGVLHGIVTDENLMIIAYADIVIDGAGRGGITQTDGSFRIPSIPHGSYTVLVNRVGYESRKIENVSVRGGLETELIVLAKLNEQTTGRIAIQDALTKQPGVAVDPNGGVHVRGARTDETQFSVDGTPVKNPAPEAAAGKSEPVMSAEQRARLTAGGYTGKASPPANDPKARREETKQNESSWNDVTTLFRGGNTSPDAQHPVSVGGSDPVNGQKFDAMFFEHYGVNPFVDAQEDRFATFAVDVDNASYTLTRSYLERNALPPKEAVRVEEFINAFPHDYVPPPASPFRAASFTELREDGGDTDHDAFAVHVDVAPSRFGDDLLLMRVGLKGREVHRLDRKPANLTFVIDVSGSMKRENRLGLVKRSLHLLLNELTTRDRVAIVVYGSTAHTVLPPTSMEQRDLIEIAIDRLSTGGSTNAEHGLVEGYINAARAFQFGAINRVILCSDGVANVGRTGADEILARIGRDASRGIELTTVGFGMGNYNDVLMEKLANNGNGNYFYVDQLREARRVFVENVTGTLQTIAQQVKAQVEFNSDVVRRYRLLGYENRDVADKDFRNDTVDAGEIGAGHEVTALFEIKLEKGARDRGRLATVRVRHEDPVTFEITERKRDVDLSDAHRLFNSMDPTFRLDAAVAEFAEILRHSYWAKDGDLNEVYRVAYKAANELRSREQADEFLRMLDRAKGLRDGLVQNWDRPDWMPDDF